jgi:hypothetical protein
MQADKAVHPEMKKPARGGLTLPAWLPRRVTSLMATTLPREAGWRERLAHL